MCVATSVARLQPFKPIACEVRREGVPPAHTAWRCRCCGCLHRPALGVVVTHDSCTAFARSTVHQMRKHTGEKPHRCSYEGCGAAFVAAAGLRGNVPSCRFHLSTRYTLIFESFLLHLLHLLSCVDPAHVQRVHEGSRPHVCSEPGCGYASNTRSNLRRK